MSNGQKTSQDYPLAWLDAWLNLDEIKPRLNNKRQKILDALTIDNLEHLDHQLSFLPWEEIRELLALFRCSIQQLSVAIQNYKERTP